MNFTGMETHFLILMHAALCKEVFTLTLNFTQNEFLFLGAIHSKRITFRPSVMCKIS